MSAAVFPVCVFLVPVGTRELNHVLSTYLLGAKEEVCHSVSLAVFVMKDFCFVGTLS